MEPMPVLTIEMELTGAIVPADHVFPRICLAVTANLATRNHNPLMHGLLTQRPECSLYHWFIPIHGFRRLELFLFTQPSDAESDPWLPGFSQESFQCAILRNPGEALVISDGLIAGRGKTGKAARQPEGITYSRW
jgi:hypothetical protein